MLTIFNKQLVEIGGYKKSELIDQITALLKSKFEEAISIDEIELKQALMRQFEAANSYGLYLDSNITIYAITAFLLGEDFDKEFETAVLYLKDPSLNENTKANALETWVNLIFQTLEMQ